MSQGNFILNNRDDVIKFERSARDYSSSQFQIAVQHISLVDAFDYCQYREDGSRLFAAFLDVFINFTLLYADMHTASKTWNARFSKGKLEGGSILDCNERFVGKMEIHRYFSSFILRYRAFWDKLMGLLVFLYAPQNYDRFVSADSRRSKFAGCVEGVPQVPIEFVQFLKTTLTEFDNKFRTPEAHGTGALRKWTLTMDGMGENPQLELIGYWNFVNETMTTLGKSMATLAREGDGPA